MKEKLEIGIAITVKNIIIVQELRYNYIKYHVIIELIIAVRIYCHSVTHMFT